MVMSIPQGPSIDPLFKFIHPHGIQPTMNLSNSSPKHKSQYLELKSSMSDTNNSHGNNMEQMVCKHGMAPPLFFNTVRVNGVLLPRCHYWNRSVNRITIGKKKSESTSFGTKNDNINCQYSHRSNKTYY